MSRIIDGGIGVLASSWAKARTGRPSSSAPVRMIHVVMSRLPCLVISDQRVHRVVLQLIAAVQKGQLDHEGHPDDLAAQLLDQAKRGGHGAAGGQEVVDR